MKSWFTADRSKARASACARHSLVIAALIVFGSCGVGRHDPDVRLQGFPPGDHELTIRHGNRDRYAIVHVPRGLRGAAPVMLAFHGGGGEAAGFKAYAGLDRVADQERFVVVYPYGTGQLPRRLLTFNAGNCCGFASERRIDDVGFAMALLDEVGRRVRIDTRRVYVTGHSNGAMMAYRIAAERAERIAAIVPVAGALQIERFRPSRPVPVLHIHSVDDPRALYDGGTGPPFPMTNHRVQHRSVEEALALWRGVNGCPDQPREEERRRGLAGGSQEDQTATKLAYSPCTSGADVVHWKLTGVGHGWPGNAGSRIREAVTGPATTLIDAAEEAWRFASRY